MSRHHAPMLALIIQIIITKKGIAKISGGFTGYDNTFKKSASDRGDRA